jgi:hypothetical protein
VCGFSKEPPNEGEKMSHPSRKLFLVMLAVFALVLSLSLTACSEDDDPVTPPGGGDTPDPDTTPPVVLSSDPESGTTRLAVDQIITAFFSENLDPDSLEGNITLSTGTITDLVLVGGQEVEIHHGDWDEGAEVTLTFATGLADTAGNNLTEPVSYQYWVYSDSLVILETDPVDGSTDVIRNTPVFIKFSKQMSTASLETGITVSTPDKAEVPFLVQWPGGSDYYLLFDDDLPENTSVTVTLGTGCQSWDAGFLEEEYVFSFETGVDLDETAPELLSLEPASGTIIPANTNSLVLTFSEAIDDESLDLIRADLLSVIAVEYSEINGGWNQDQTVLTVIFAGPLPAGVEMTLQLDDFMDLQGNINSSHPIWNVTVEGEAEHYPVDERFVHIFARYEDSGRDGFNDYMEFFHAEWGDDGHFMHKRFDTELEAWNEWENMIQTSTAIMMDGFREIEEGEDVDMVFDNPVQFLNRPMETASWSGDVEIIAGEDTMTVDFNFEVLPGLTDMPFAQGPVSKRFSGSLFSGEAKIVEMEMFWPNCRTLIQEIEGSAGGETMFTQNDTLVYCPGFGLIKEYGHELNGGGEERDYNSDLVGFELFEDF